MNQGNLSVDKATNENFLRMSHRLQYGEDLVTLRMAPPTPLDGPADDHLSKARNGALARYEDHALLPNKCHCLIGGHMHVPGAERDGSTDRSGRCISCLIDQRLKKRAKNAASAVRLLGNNSGATST